MAARSAGGLSLEQILEQIAEIAPSLHSAGTPSREILRALFRHAAKRRIDYSAETRSGVTTLLLSHLSKNHTVFALDAGDASITNVKDSALLERSAVTFVKALRSRPYRDTDLIKDYRRYH
jgi:hypothetical protein